MPTIYRITKMTGRRCNELVKEAKRFQKIFESHGIKVLDPVLIEGIPDMDKLLEALPDAILKKLWLRDKWCLRKAHVALNCNASLKSIGAEHEAIVMRGTYWKPYVLVYPNTKRLPFISRFEDDYVTNSIQKACKAINQRWGTYPKRLKWRIPMLLKSVPKLILRQTVFLFQ